MNDKYDYTYKALAPHERKEVENIRNKFSANNEHDALTELRKINDKIENVPTTISLIIGIIGALIFGLGMAMILEWDLIILGIIVGCVGIIPIVFAFPFYKRYYNLLKDKYKDEILTLTEKLLDGKENNDD